MTRTSTPSDGGTTATQPAAARPARAPRRRGRLRALLAGGLVLGVGSVSTLAAWTDTEWVFGDDRGDGERTGLTASVFEVQQNVWDGASGTALWADREEAPGAGALEFGVDASALSPGTTVFAPMQLRTVAGSRPGDVLLQGAVRRAGSQPFFDALRYRVVRGVDRTACAAGDLSGGTTVVAAGAALAAGAPAVFPVAGDGPAEASRAVDLCFAVSLPADASQTLQGLGAEPVWAFASTSR